MAAQAVFTDAYRAKLADLAADDLGAGVPDMMRLLNFKVGEGGFVEVPPASGNRFPTTPDPALTDLESVGSPSQFTFTKAIGGANISDDGAGTLTVICRLDSNEAGLDGQGLLDGTDPHLYEVGIFDEDGTMMVYGTFDEELKVVGKAIDLEIVVVY